MSFRPLYLTTGLICFGLSPQEALKVSARLWKLLPKLQLPNLEL